MREAFLEALQALQQKGRRNASSHRPSTWQARAKVRTCSLGEENVKLVRSHVSMVWSRVRVKGF